MPRTKGAKNKNIININVNSSNPADVIKEVFTVDNGNVSYTGYTTC
jgi:hypothetical protein